MTAPAPKTDLPRIKRILLIRHGFSLGNADPSQYAKLGDPNVPLYEKGWEQAIAAGAFLKDYYAKNGTHFAAGPRIWASSFQRTRDTAGGLIEGAQGALDHCSPIFESPDLVEQDFGIFAHNPDRKWRELNMPLEQAFTRARAKQHKFFSRLPHGESPYDTYLRMGDVIASMQRDCHRKGEDDLLVVCHGVTLRCFAMRFLHISDRAWDHFRNPGNCDIYAIELGGNGHYGMKKIYDGEQGLAVDINILADLRTQVPALTPQNLPKPPRHLRIRP